MDYPIAELDRRLAALIQAGVVAEVDHASARCRVRVGEWVSALLPWLSLGAGEARHWRPPSVGEQALLVSPSGEPAAGFVLPGFYAAGHGQAGDRRAKAVAWRMPDGCLLEYDWEAGALRATGCETVSVEASGEITLKCASLLVDAPRVSFKGDVSIAGNVKAGGDVDAAGAVMDGGGNSNHHVH
ncbi:phage baseplate assembly protein V [Pseudoduganella namucuonensis]|uniref:Phage baseplate assembly protein V n=1 Tax=Pseudoduganella namucuonensis TaxID=1035707 RepID=A0A1I7J388_9BURK|nr:phage baseplate assembly protein V [Pseudoduganella namucuonensis]SFU79591.1 phage baseplate assembly protein V [Pseudoduganella namucuonensis]